MLLWPSDSRAQVEKEKTYEKKNLFIYVQVYLQLPKNILASESQTYDLKMIFNFRLIR